MEREFPLILRFLNEEMNYQVRPAKTSLGFELYYLDLSSWKLRLTNLTPVIWVKAQDVEHMSTRHLYQSLQDVIRERSWRRQIVLVLLDGDPLPLRSLLKSPVNSLVVIGADDQARVLASRRPTGELRDQICAQLPLSNLAPYETSAPVTGSRFFGRQYELNRILGSARSNYMVLGIRRIGKTSLLQEVQRVLTGDEEVGHVVYMDCSDLLSTDDYVREVVRKLHPKELPRVDMQRYAFFFPNFLQRMKRMYHSKIVFLLDEIDNLVMMQRGEWDLFQMLRSSSNKGACQYIFAGYREAMHDFYLHDSPFRNFADELRLAEFNRDNARDLILTPMENLGVRFRNASEVVGRIYEETAGQPNLIQYYCKVLLQRLDATGEREISPDSLLDVYNDTSFKNHLLNTFMQNTTQSEKALVLSLLVCRDDERLLAGFRQSEIDECLHRNQLHLSLDEIEQACQVLVLTGVWEDKGKMYYFTSPVFTRLLRQSKELDFLLSKIREERMA